MKRLGIILMSFLLLSACTTVRQGEVGVKRTFGKLHPRTLSAGLHTFNIFTTTIIKIPTRTINLEVNQDLPSKEGVLVATTISILYRVHPDSVPSIITNIGGTNYEDVVILSVFKSAAPNISSRFYAKDMHTIERANIEKEILTLMRSILTQRGFIMEAVLLKSIRLPQGLAKSIEEKLESEQEAQRMEFVLAKEKREAERKRVEAEGIRDYQRIITEGLNPLIIEWKSIETFKDLSRSPNTKIIITDGRTPFLINPTDKDTK
jgi:regulator of protease activity HflC (stomatin/prohibitin superfamily)